MNDIDKISTMCIILPQMSGYHSKYHSKLMMKVCILNTIKFGTKLKNY